MWDTGCISDFDNHFKKSKKYAKYGKLRVIVWQMVN